jgi:hypothetical protein
MIVTYAMMLLNSFPCYNSVENCNYSYYQKNMNDTSGVKAHESNRPGDDQDHCYDIE